MTKKEIKGYRYCDVRNVRKAYNSAVRLVRRLVESEMPTFGHFHLSIYTHFWSLTTSTRKK